MSVRVLSRALDVPDVSATEKLVLVILANYADDSGLCWPAIASVAAKACMSDRGVRGIIRRLEDRGLVTTEVSGGRSSNRYYVLSNPEAGAGSTRKRVPGSQRNPEAGAGFNPARGDSQPGTAVPPNRQEPSLEIETAAVALHSSGREAAAAENPDSMDRQEGEGSFLDQVRDAAGASESGAWRADQRLSLHVARWRALALTENEILAILRNTSRGRLTSSPAYFDAAMREFAGAKVAPPLVPIASTSPSRQRSSTGADDPGLARIRRRYGIK